MQIEMAAKLLELDDSIRVIIIKGQGPSFCAGYDLTPVKKGERAHNFPSGGYINPERDRLWQSYDLEHARVYMMLFDLPEPVIAQIQGGCLAGGSELAGFRDQGLYASRGKYGEDGDEFMKIAERDGLKAALKWREETFGNSYRESDADD